MDCHYCKSKCQKAGWQKNGKQKYQCVICKKYQQAAYAYTACGSNIEEQLVRHLKRGCGIRDIAYLLSISATTVIRKIRKISKGLSSPYSAYPGMIYEMDELHTYIGNKKNETWVMYSISRHNTKDVLAVKTGRRLKDNLKKVVDVVLSFNPRRIYTDGLNSYPGLIPKEIHKAGRYYTNKIERVNLNLRTHLKRLFRYTICYSKKEDMLEACLRIYFWA